MSQRKLHISRIHCAQDVNQFAPLVNQLIRMAHIINPNLALSPDSNPDEVFWQDARWYLTENAKHHLVEDYNDLATQEEVFLVNAHTPRVRFKFAHGKNNLPLRTNWSSESTLKRLWEFAQQPQSERLQSNFKCKTLVLDLILLHFGWEGYGGFLNGWRLENTAHCLPLPEDFK